MRFRTTLLTALAITTFCPAAGAQEQAEEALADDGQVDAGAGVGEQARDNAGRPTPGEADEQGVCSEIDERYAPIGTSDVCLRIGGYIRVDAGAGELNGLDLDGDDGESSEGWNTNARFAFNTYTSMDTELGQLNTFTEVRFNYGNAIDGADTAGPGTQVADTDVSINFAWIELAGVRVGKSETLFDTFTGYGGAVINDATIGGYGPFDTNLISYTLQRDDGLEAALSLEQGGTGFLTDDYVPHVVLAAGLERESNRLRASVAYDTRVDTADALAGGGALKLRLDRSLNETDSVFAIALFGENASGYTTWRTGDEDDDTASLIAGHTVAHRANLSSNSQLQWAEGNGDKEVLNAVVNLAWNLVADLTLTPELQWVRDADGENAYGGVLRAQASF